MGALSDGILALSPYAYYKCDEASGLPQDSSGNARHGVSLAGTAIQHKAVGLGGQGNYAYSCVASPNGIACNVPTTMATGMPASGGVTGMCVFRPFAFNNRSIDIYSQSQNHANVYGLNLGSVNNGSPYSMRLGNRGVGYIFDTGPVVDDRSRFHIVIFKFTYNTSATVRLNGTDLAPTVTWSTLTDPGGTPAPRICQGRCDVVLGHIALWADELSVADCQTLEAAFEEDHVWRPRPGRRRYGIHTDQMFVGEADTQKVRNRVYHARKLHFTLQRHSMLHDIANPTGTDTADHTNATYDWDRPDAIMAWSADMGMDVYWVITGSAPAINGGANRQVVPGTGVDATFTTWRDKMCNFARACVDRYKPGGPQNPDRINVWWEIWNEPNLGGSWDAAGDPDGVQYANFYNAMRAAILERDASAKVVCGATAAFHATGVGSINGQVFLRNMVANGLGTVDYYSHHPYADNNAPITDTTAFVNHFDDILWCRDVLNELGYENTKLIAGEFGWTSTTSEADQATKTAAAIDRIESRYRNVLDMVIFFVLDATSFAHCIFNPSIGEPVESAATAKQVAEVYRDRLRAHDPAGQSRRLLGVG